MNYGFSSEFAPLDSNCLKWKFIPEGGDFIYGDHADPDRGDRRLLPMWVADMDFRSPPALIEALVERAQQGVYGYSRPGDSYFEAVIDWFARRYGNQIEREWITVTPGVVPSLNMMMQAFLEPGEKVLVQRPVYHPFFSVIENNGGIITSNSLTYENGQYFMDFDDLATRAADPAVRIAILCSPHNPIGRVWTAEELIRFGEICLANDILVIADEIHCDLIYPGTTFSSFATLKPEFKQRSIVCAAASKSFNLAGLKTSTIVIPDPELRQRFRRVIERNGLFGGNTFGLVATEAAYRTGDEWLQAVMNYVEDNYRFMAGYFARHLPQFTVTRPTGTYFAWVNFGSLGLDPAERKRVMMEEACLLLDEGEKFGPEGEGFERFNIACPRSILEEAVHRVHRLVSPREDERIGT